MIYESCDKRFTRRLVFKRPAKELEVAICGRDSEGCEKTCEGSLRILLLDYRQFDGDNVVLKLGLEALRARPPTAICLSLSSVKTTSAAGQRLRILIRTFKGYDLTLLDENMSLILVMGVYHGSPRLLTDKAWGELVHRCPSLAEMSPLPKDLEMCLNKFLDDIRQRAEPMRTKRKGLARGFSTFGRVLVSQKRLIVLAVLRGLDDDGCLELLKGLPHELPGVDSHFTSVAVNAGGGGKTERPSLLFWELQPRGQS